MEPQSPECVPPMGRLNCSCGWTVGTIYVGDGYAGVLVGAKVDGCQGRWLGDSGWVSGESCLAQVGQGPKRKTPKYKPKRTIFVGAKTVHFGSYPATSSDVAYLKTVHLMVVNSCQEINNGRDFIVVFNDSGSKFLKKKT